MATGKQLMKEIYDQFLLCKICIDIYRRPKTLSCLHTFCADCIEKHSDAEYERSYRYMLYNRSVTCPICRKKTDIPTGGIRRLPDNFLVANLADVVSRRKPGEFQECEICKPDIPSRQKQAKRKCLDCCKLLCNHCVDLHMKTKVTQNHSLFDIEVERDIECKVHQDEVVRFYCEPCELCICVVCTFQEHKGHEISSFSEGMQKYQKSLDTVVSMCRERISNVKDQIDLITNCETVIKNAEEQIRDMAIDSITDIRKNERKLVSNLHDVYGEDTFQFLKEKEPLLETLENLQSTCNLTDIISKDKRIELLLLRKEIQDKVNSLLGNDLNHPPANVMKEVKFVPGRLEFGYLDVKGQSTSTERDEVPNIKISHDKESVESQTDIVPVCNQATLTERLMMFNTQTSGESKVTQTLIVQTQDSCTSPILPPSPKIRSRFTMTTPINMQNCQTMTRPPAKSQARTQTKPVHMIDTSSNTNIHSYHHHEVPTENKCTNTPSSPKCERSTLTIVKTHKDQLTDTRGLLSVKHQETVMTSSQTRDQLSMTEPKLTNNQSTLTSIPDKAEKYTFTTKTITLERPTMTDSVVMFDIGVNAKLLGTNKATATKTIVTMDSCYGDNVVSTKDQYVETPWGRLVPKPTKDSGTMYNAVALCDVASGSDVMELSDKNTFTNYFNQSDSFTNTTEVELMDCSTETDILGEIMRLEETKDLKLQKLVEKCTLNGITCEMISEMLVKNEVLKKEVCTSTDLLLNSPKTTVNSIGTTTDNITYDDIGITCGSSAFDLINNSTLTERCTYNHVETTMDSCVYTNDSITNTEITEHNDRSTNSPTDLKINSDDTRSVNIDSSINQEIGVSITAGNSQYRSVATVTEPIIYTSNDNSSAMMWTSPPVVSNNNGALMESCVYTRNIGLSDEHQNENVVYNDKIPVHNDKISLKFKDACTTTGHYVQTCDQGSRTNVIEYRDNESEMVSPQYNSVGVHTMVEMKSVGVLKRPHTTSRGSSTKKLKTNTTTTETNPVVLRNQEINTCIETKDSSCDPIKFSCISKCQGTLNIVLKDCSSSTINPQLIERGCSPHPSPHLVNRGSSPIRYESSEVAISVKPTTQDGGTDAPVVMMQDTGVSPYKIHTSNKSVSPIPNLIPKKNRATSTTVVEYESRALSPIRPVVVQCGTNTMKATVKSQGLSPIKFKGNDVGTLMKPDVESKETETNVLSTQDSSTETKRIRTHNKSIGMPQVHYAEKHTATPQIHTINKMVCTDHYSTVDKQTMTYDITANYRDNLPPRPPVTVNRGTNTKYISMVSKDTSPERTEYTEKASSPVRIITFNKGVMASKADLIEPKEKFHTASLQTKPLRPIADSPKSNLESIEELRESDEEYASKEIQTETPPRSPRALMGRRAISAVDLTQTSPSPYTHKEKFVLSTPRIGKRNAADESTFSPFRCGNAKLICRVETATNTKGIGLESKGTSTPPVAMEDKAVCTEAIHVTKDDKMAACISKLQTVRQRLEQQPVYVQAPAKHHLSKSTDCSPESPTNNQPGTLSKSDHSTEQSHTVEVKSSLSMQHSTKSSEIEKTQTFSSKTMQSEDIKILTKKMSPKRISLPLNKPPEKSAISEAEKSIESIVSPQLLRRTLIKQDSSEDSEDSHSKLKHSLARKKKPALAQLLERSSSLPEQDSPPYSIPKPKLRTIVPHVIPKLNVETVTSPRMSRKADSISQGPLVKGRHRKSSPVAMGTRIRPILAGMPAFGAANQPSILPNTADKQKARQEKAAKLRKERQAQSLPLSDSKPPVVPVNKCLHPKKVTTRGSRPRTSNLPSIQDDSSSSSS